MAVCAHCKGTGVAPEKIILECEGCQRPVNVTYADTADLHRKTLNVRCTECRKWEVECIK